MTFAAIPCIADHGFPQSPDKGFVELRDLEVEDCDWEVCIKEEAGSEVTFRRDLGARPPNDDVGVGDAFLEAVLLAASSLPSAA